MLSITVTCCRNIHILIRSPLKMTVLHLLWNFNGDICSRVLHIKAGHTKFYISNFISTNKRSAKCYEIGQALRNQPSASNWKRDQFTGREMYAKKFVYVLVRFSPDIMSDCYG